MPIRSNKKIELLLLQNVESLGIVGDVVKVRPGYARNYLLPLGIAEPPTEDKLASLTAAREEALKELEAKRDKQRSTVDRLNGVSLTMVRSTNDQGVLYGSVTQRDIVDALKSLEVDVEYRDIRLQSAIRRVGTYEILIQFNKDLATSIQVVIESDQPLDTDQDEDVDADKKGTKKTDNESLPSEEDFYEEEDKS